jgi:hypothetical protein
MKTGRIRSDYDPDTVLSIVQTDDGDICIGIFGEDEFRIAGHSGGSHLPSHEKCKLITLFSEIIDVLARLKDDVK